MNLSDLLLNALKEDMPDGDITTDSLAMGPRPGVARLIAKGDLILSGRMAFEETVRWLEPEVKMKWQFDDGGEVLRGQTLAIIEGDLIQILKAERVGLNFLGHLSGIATLTREFVKRVSPYKTRILDTRKTIPGYRDLERKAVRDGGGQNHRLNLSAAILVKENHIRAAGGITEAITRIRAHSTGPMIVEARDLREVQECVKNTVGRILLDNMTTAEMKECLRYIPPEIQTEASGNMTVDRVGEVAAIGVQFISVGALTHSAPFADVSLMFDWKSPAP